MYLEVVAINLGEHKSHRANSLIDTVRYFNLKLNEVIMSPKSMRKYVKSRKYKPGKFRNGVFCSCRQCELGGRGKNYRNFKLNG